VLGFIVCAFYFLTGLIVMLSGSMLSSHNLPIAISAKGMGFGYLIVAILLFFPFLFLNRSCNAINNALMSSKNEELEAGLINMKSYWKYVGILTIVLLAMIPICLIVFIIGR
jgi:hypothetical protein